LSCDELASAAIRIIQIVGRTSIFILGKKCSYGSIPFALFVGIDTGKYKKFNFCKKGHKNITVLVYRNTLFLYQDQLLDFQKEKLECNYGFCKT
jgi:hypothetical protein